MNEYILVIRECTYLFTKHLKIEVSRINKRYINYEIVILLATFDNKIVNKNFNEPYIL